MLYGGEVTINCIESLATDFIKRRLSECEIFVITLPSLSAHASWQLLTWVLDDNSGQ